jgi:hypothetical protein
MQGRIAMTEPCDDTSIAPPADDPRIPSVMRYFSALGAFVSNFALVETALNQLVWQYANLDKTTATALLSALRVDACIQNLGRIVEAKALSGPKIIELRIILEQLGLITRLRNDILHFGIEKIKEDIVLVSNSIFAHVDERTRKLYVSGKTFIDLNHDLAEIFFRLLRQRLSPNAPAEIPYLAQPAWRYKPPSQSPHQPENPDKPPRRRRQPRSSSR